MNSQKHLASSQTLCRRETLAPDRIVWRTMFQAAVLLFLEATLLALPASQGARGPLMKNEIIDLLRNAVPPARVESLVRQYGVAFELTDQGEKELREAGATDQVVNAIRELGRPMLIVEVAPAGAKVFVDDEPGEARPEGGRLVLAGLPEGTHRVRLTLKGYRDHEETVELQRGRTWVLKAVLEASPEAPPPSPRPIAKASVTPEPTRFRVGRGHGLTGLDLGWLSISEGTVHFRADGAGQSFDVGVHEIKEMKSYPSGLELKLVNGKKYLFAVFDDAGKSQASPEPIIDAIRRAAAKD